MKRGASALLVFFACTSCSSATFRGGYTQPEGALSGTRSLARFRPAKCQDRAQRELSARFTSLELLETRAGRPLLLERRLGHEWLVIDNAYDDGAFLMFELIVQGERVRRYRIPRQAGEGRLEMGRDFEEQREGDAFRTRLAAPSFTCWLVPDAH